MHYYKYGHLIQRAFGLFSIESNRWSLYANKTTGSAEIAVDAEEAWIVPLIQDADGRIVETYAVECRSGLYYMKCVVPSPRSPRPALPRSILPAAQRRQDVRTSARVCAVRRSTDPSMRMVTVEYGPQLVNGSAIFLAFKLGVTDIYSKTLPTVALQKTASRRTTVAGALLTHAASRSCLAPRRGARVPDLDR